MNNMNKIIIVTNLALLIRKGNQFGCFKTASWPDSLRMCSEQIAIRSALRYPLKEQERLSGRPPLGAKTIAPKRRWESHNLQFDGSSQITRLVTFVSDAIHSQRDHSSQALFNLKFSSESTCFIHLPSPLLFSSLQYNSKSPWIGNSMEMVDL